jgi:threonylcarbamoyladenosine tRNA methylthiotransferase CDKAL1
MKVHTNGGGRGSVSGKIMGLSCLESAKISEIRDKKVWLKTFGCTYNFGDSEKLAEVLRSQQCTLVSSHAQAEVIIINTCTVVAPTERKMLRLLGRLKDTRLYVTGCMPLVQMDLIRSVCSPEFIHPDDIHDYYAKTGTVRKGHTGIVQLAKGCRGACTYCITRRARGRLCSFPRDEIVSYTKQLVAAGACEIQLTAQDVSAWGTDTGESLPSLLGDLADIPGDFSIRVGMMNPAGILPILDPLIDAYTSDRIFKFIHIPVQSGSDTVIRRMGRNYSADDFLAIVTAFRRRYPDITLSTDIIVGFPGETDDEFDASVELVRKARPNKVNVTRYSSRPGTPAADSYDMTDYAKKNRSRLIQKAALDGYHRINTGLIGKEVPVMVTETIRSGSVLTRTPEYTNVVLQEDLPAGFRCRAVIREDRTYFFLGERVF